MTENISIGVMFAGGVLPQLTNAQQTEQKFLAMLTDPPLGTENNKLYFTVQL